LERDGEVDFDDCTPGRGSFFCELLFPHDINKRMPVMLIARDLFFILCPIVVDLLIQHGSKEVLFLAVNSLLLH
jgi:hypothetical protein